MPHAETDAPSTESTDVFADPCGCLHRMNCRLLTDADAAAARVAVDAESFPCRRHGPDRMVCQHTLTITGRSGPARGGALWFLIGLTLGASAVALLL
ncbi:MAG: hypothetical protein IT459_17020 [Planctomycetes bacterium]|nr:hypothetical protein [Planctomycetota bacterium]